MRRMSYASYLIMLSRRAAAGAAAAGAAYAHNFKLHTAQWHQHNKSAKGPSD